MKKSLLSLMVLVFSMSQLFSQTATSTGNGNWTNPMIWDCFCVPTQTYDAVITSDVTLNTDFAITTGSITVNAGASLMQDATQRDLWINGGDFVNNGTVDLKRILMSSGSFVNNDTLYVQTFANYLNMINDGKILSVDSLYNDGTITNNDFIDVNTFYNDNLINNYGVFEYLDSLYNAGTFLNDIDATIIADSCTNAGIFTNNGDIGFYDFTNLGTFTNNSNLTMGHDFLNIGTFLNNDYVRCINSTTNAGYFENIDTAWFAIDNSFLNADSLNNDACFVIEGMLLIGYNMWNFDTIRGTNGSIQVYLTTYNAGNFLGSFDFCDLTQTATSEPFIDANLAFIDENISYCNWNSVENKFNNSNITIFPNPTTDALNIEPFDNYRLEIYNVLGELILISKNQSTDVSKLISGIYFVNLFDSNANVIHKTKIIKN